MSTSPETLSRIWQRLAVIITAVVCVQSYAYKPMPALPALKANQSLLLDIEKAGDRLITVGERGHILISDDGGNQWQQSEVPINQMLNAVSFPDSQHGWAVGHDGHILKTTDGGDNWLLQRNGLSAQAELNVRNVQYYTSEVDRLEKVLSSENLDPAQELVLKDELDEAQWQLDSARDKSGQAPIANPLLDVWFSNTNDGWVVGAFGLLLHTHDGGETWQDMSNQIDNEMGYHLNAVSGTENGTVIVAGEAGFIRLSQDNGQTWKISDLGYDGTVFALESSPSGNQVAATGLRGKTFLLDESNLSWKDVTPNVGFSLAGIEFIDQGQYLLVGHGGTVAYTEDSGASYAYSTLPSRVSISTAAFNGKDSFIFVGQGGIRSFSLTQLSANK